MLKKVISVILILSFVLVFANQLSDHSDYNLGKVNGERDGKSDASFLLWSVIGCATTCLIGGALAYFIPGAVPSERIIGQSPDYSKGYTDAYIEAKRWRQVTWAAVGGCVSATASGALYILTVFASASY